MLRYDERWKTYSFEVSVDDSRVVHVEQAPGYVYELQSKTGQETHKGKEWKPTSGVLLADTFPAIYSLRHRCPMKS